MPYVADTDTSKSKPLAAQQSISEFWLVLLIGCIPLVYFWHFQHFLSLFISGFILLFCFRWGFKAWLIKRLGGFTGDCLGAAQQIAELLIYLLLYYFITLEHASTGVEALL